MRNPDTPVPFQRRRFLAALVAVAGGGLLPGCGGPRQVWEDPGLKRMAERGYAPARRYATETVVRTWHASDTVLEVSLTLPREAVRCPLIVYLPGLGEDTSGGGAWREAWAEAGYAVLALQHPGHGPEIWARDRARNADFAAVAREAFAPATLPGRVRLVKAALAELAREPLLARVDPDRPILAGREFGAQTALALAGERDPDGRPLADPLEAVAAVLAISPHVDVAGGGLARRFGHIAPPVLLVTGSEDMDNYGFVNSPSSRQAAFPYLPDGQAALLLLDDADHDLLSGGGGAIRPGRQAGPGTEDEPAGGPPASGGGPPSRGRGGRGPMGGLGGDADTGQRGPPGALARRDTRRPALAVRTVTVAWLDAVARDDPVAREWLDRDATRWLGEIASLRRR